MRARADDGERDLERELEREREKKTEQVLKKKNKS